MRLPVHLCAPAALCCRAKVFFDIGLNVGRLLSLPAGVGMLGRATLQMLAEFEYHTAADGALADLVRLSWCACLRRLLVRSRSYRSRRVCVRVWLVRLRRGGGTWKLEPTETDGN